MKQLRNSEIEKLKKIKIVLLDLKGVLLKSRDLREICHSDFKSCFSRLVDFFKERNILIGIVSASEDELIDELKNSDVEVKYASIDKVGLAREILEKHNLAFENLLYIGDEILDMPLLQKAGFSVAPAKSIRTVRRIVDYTAEACCGEELVEELKQLFLTAEKSKSIE